MINPPQTHRCIHTHFRGLKQQKIISVITCQLQLCSSFSFILGIILWIYNLLRVTNHCRGLSAFIGHRNFNTNKVKSQANSWVGHPKSTLPQKFNPFYIKESYFYFMDEGWNLWLLRNPLPDCNRFSNTYLLPNTWIQWRELKLRIYFKALIPRVNLGRLKKNR